MLGSSIATSDVSGISVPDLPDAVAHIITLQLQNQDNFGSQYGLRGTLNDYKLLIRNSYESPKAGQPRISRHNAEFQMITRPTIVSGVVTPAIPYIAGVTVRLPETGTAAVMATVALNLFYLLGAGSFTTAKLTKMMNFES